MITDKAIQIRDNKEILKLMNKKINNTIREDGRKVVPSREIILRLQIFNLKNQDSLNQRALYHHHLRAIESQETQ